MPNSHATEADNGVITAVYPNPDVAIPHVALMLTHLTWRDGEPVAVVARLSPTDARALAVSLTASADRVQVDYEKFAAERDAGDAFGE